MFLALGGAILAFVPGAPSFTVLPELALALSRRTDAVLAHCEIHGLGLQAARHAVLAMRANEEMMHFISWKRELDWIEVSGGGKEDGEPEG